MMKESEDSIKDFSPKNSLKFIKLSLIRLLVLLEKQKMMQSELLLKQPLLKTV
jgi:hypothetical protein